MSKDEVWDLLIESLQEVLPSLEGRRLKPEDTLEELGANSLDRSETIMLVLERMNLRIPLVQTVGPRNIGELATLLSEKSS